MRLSNSDKRVILKFIDRQTGDNKNFFTDGQVLDGLWMGGRDLAHWFNDYLELPAAGGRAMQTVQNFIRKNTSRKWIESLQAQYTKYEKDQYTKKLEEQYPSVYDVSLCKKLARTIKQYIGGQLPSGVNANVSVTDYPTVTIEFQKGPVTSFAEIEPVLNEDDDIDYWDIYTKVGNEELYGRELDMDQEWASDADRVFNAVLKHLWDFGGMDAFYSVLDVFENTK